MNQGKGLYLESINLTAPSILLLGIGFEASKKRVNVTSSMNWRWEDQGIWLGNFSRSSKWLDKSKSTFERHETCSMFLNCRRDSQKHGLVPFRFKESS